MRYADTFCTVTEQFKPRHTYTFSGPCIVTKKTYSVTVMAEELYAYRRGALSQNAFKSLTAEQREFLISGCSPEGWNLLYGEEEG